MELLDKIAAWINSNLGLIFMGIAGSTITALITPQKRVKDRVISFIVGVILCCSLSDHTANFLTHGDYVGLFGFVYGMGGMTLAKMILIAIEKKGKAEIESKAGVKIDDDAN